MQAITIEESYSSDSEFPNPIYIYNRQRRRGGYGMSVPRWSETDVNQIDETRGGYGIVCGCEGRGRGRVFQVFLVVNV